jgi:uncharacterized protein with GYD domain
MPRYISLISYTQEGIRNIKDTEKRARHFAEKAEKKGISIKETYWTIGRYDIVHVFEAPDDEAAAAVAFALGSMGNVRTETLRAFDFDEMQSVLREVYDFQLDQGTLK